MATDLSNAVHKKNTRNANNDATVSNNQDLLDLLDLDMSAPTTTPVMGINMAADPNSAANMNNMLGGLDLSGFGGGIDAMPNSIPTNGNDLASMLGRLNVAGGAPVHALAPLGSDVNSSSLLGELNPTAASNNVTVVYDCKISPYASYVNLKISWIAASTGSQANGPGQERTASAAGAGARQ